MGIFIDLTNKKFGRLTVLSKSKIGPNKRWLWFCKCSCGTEKEIDGQTLRAGESQSCGCFNADQKRLICFQRNTTHGMGKTKIYKIWIDMRNRCNNPNNNQYHRYGAKGIFVDPKWDNFMGFFNDMGYPPSAKHSIDRINTYGPYSKNNCRWVLPVVQQNNRTNNRLITHNGKTFTLQQWAKLTGIPRKTISNRIDRGWPVDKSLNYF